MKFKYDVAIKGLDRVTTELGPGEIVGFTANTFAGFDASGNLESIPGWGISVDTGGAAAFLNLAPSADVGTPSTWVINNLQNSVNPSVPLVNLSFQNMQNYWTVSGSQDTAGHIGFNNGLILDSSGNAVDMQAMANNLALGNGVDTNSSRNSSIISQYGQIRTNHTAENFAHFASYAQLDGTITGGLSGVQLGNNITGSIGGFSAFSNNTIIEATGSIANFSSGVNEGLTVRNGATIQGHAGISVNPQLEAGSTIASNYNGISVGGSMDGTITNGWAGLTVFPNFTGNFGSLQSIATNLNMNSGTTVTNGLDGIQAGIGMQTGTSALYAHLYNGNFQAASGATIPQFDGIALFAAFDNNTTTDAKLINVAYSGTGSVTNVQGLSVDVDQLASPNRKTSISGNGGALVINSPVNTGVTTVNLAESGNNLGGQFTIAAGHPLTSGEFVFGNNLAYSSAILDDMNPDVTGYLGFTNVGFVGQISVAAGKTIDTYNLAGGGAGVPAVAGDGGTVTNAVMFSALGLLPSGGNISVTNMYGFRVSPILSAVAPTNAWGISVEDANANNYFAKNVVIGGITKLPTFSAALDVTGDATFSGVIKDNTNAESADFNNRTMKNSAGSVTVDYDNSALNAADGSASCDAENRKLVDSTASDSLDWEGRTLKDSAGTVRLDWSTSTLISDATEIRLDANGGTQQGIKFFDDSNTNSTTIRAAGTTTTSVTYDLPPADGNSGDVLSTDGAGVMSWIAPPFTPVYLYVYQLTPQLISLTTLTTLLMDIYTDSASGYSTITGGWTCPTTGMYEITVGLQMTAFSGYFFPGVTVNGTPAGQALFTNDPAYGDSGVISRLVSLAASDVVTATVYQASGGSQNTTASEATYMIIRRIA